MDNNTNELILKILGSATIDPSNLDMEAAFSTERDLKITIIASIDQIAKSKVHEDGKHNIIYKAKIVRLEDMHIV